MFTGARTAVHTTSFLRARTRKKIKQKKCGCGLEKIRAHEKTVLGVTVGELLPDDDVHFVLNQCLTPTVPKGQDTQHRIQLSDLRYCQVVQVI